MVSLVLFLLSYPVTVVIASYGYKMSDLLKNQLDVQISLSTPEYYAEAVAQNPSTAMDQAVEFLIHEQVPFRFYFCGAGPKPPPIVSHPMRLVKNQRVWVAIVAVLRKSERVLLF